MLLMSEDILIHQETFSLLIYLIVNFSNRNSGAVFCFWIPIFSYFDLGIYFHGQNRMLGLYLTSMLILSVLKMAYLTF